MPDLSLAEIEALEKESAAELAKAQEEIAWEMAQGAVDAIGILDPTPISDLTSAGMSLRKGDYGGAALSLISVFPYLGDAIAKPIKGTRMAQKIFKLRAKVTKWLSEIQRLKKLRKEVETANALRKETRVLETVSKETKDAGKIAEKIKPLPKSKPAPKSKCRLNKKAKQSLSKHQQAIDAHRIKYEEMRNRALREGNSGKARSYKGRIAEANGERAATDYMIKHHPEHELASGFEVGGGFDQIWIKRGVGGSIENIIIVEAKGGKKGLAMTKNKGKQMSREWVEKTAKEWKSDSELKDLMNTLLRGLEKGSPKVEGKAIRSLENGGSEIIPIPKW